MKYSDIKINCIYKLKSSQEVWCIDIQQRFVYPKDCNTYVKVTNTVFDHRTLFGKVVEENAFDAIEKYEIEFNIDQLEDSIRYDTIEEFNTKVLNEERNKFLFVDYPYLATPLKTINMEIKVVDIKDSMNNTEFKAGDKVCYKSHPNICIGYVSSDIDLGNLSFIHDGIEVTEIPIHVSDDWVKHFGHGTCTNSMRVNINDIMKYVDRTR